MDYTQEHRLIEIDTSRTGIGQDDLLLQSLTGNEAISRLFSFQLELLSTELSLDFNDIMGKNVTLRITLADGSPRYINGYVSRFAQSAKDLHFAHYQAEVVPWAWFLTRNADCRIFQHKTVPDIIQQVVSEAGFASHLKLSLCGRYQPVEYCVQYRETDFNFISRLMEHNGIFYFFEHTSTGHTMVLGDKPCVHQPCPDQSVVRFDEITGGVNEEDVVTSWQTGEELRTGKCSLTDYNFETPSANLVVSEPTIISRGDNSKFEIFDYPGVHPAKGDGQAIAKIRMQEHEAAQKVSRGTGVCRSFISGCRFTLQDYYRSDANTSYVLTEVQHSATAGASYSTESGALESYSNQFRCIKAEVPFRPPRVTLKPFVQGPQPALVVGKAGEEIWTDKYGRVMVQFYWDRLGKKDENSSCWIRVSSPWAGGGFGAVSLPRIGQEVIVDFLEGDPDRPIIMGRVYNAGQMPPYGLPGMATRSTIQSRSSKGGGTANYNEIRFEDLKGSEQVFLNAEKDMDHRVEQEYREYVGANRHLIVNASQYEQVNADKHGHVKGKHLEKIEGDRSLQVGGNYTEKITRNASVTISGDRKQSITGNDSCTITGEEKREVKGLSYTMFDGGQVEGVTKDYYRAVGGKTMETLNDVDQELWGNYWQTVHGMWHVTTEELAQLTSREHVVIHGDGKGVTISGGPDYTSFISIGPEGVQIVGPMVLINSGGSVFPMPPNRQPDTPPSPSTPDTPDNPVDPTDPDVADDGSQGTKLNGGASGAGSGAGSGAASGAGGAGNE